MLKSNKIILNEKEDTRKLHSDYITVIIALSGVHSSHSNISGVLLA